MKKIISLLSTVVIAFMSLFIVSADTVSIPANRPHFIGTFVQPWLYASWSAERANQEFTHMKEIGIEYIIMGDTLTKTKSGTKFSYDVTYPTTIAEATSGYGGFDMVGMLLSYCKKYDIKCYLGMGNQTPWDFMDSRTGVLDFGNFAASVATDLYNQYKSIYPDTFYGFYFTPELANFSGYNATTSRDAYVANFSDCFNTVLDTINKLDPNMPMLYSPYVNVVSSNATFENTMQFYTDLYKKTNFREIDILCPQDSIGAGGQKLDTLEKWTKGYKDAIALSGKTSKLWANCEDFVQPTSTVAEDWTSCDTKRFIQQLAIADKYCESIVTFAYPHYWSPYNVVSGFDRSYIDYLTTGTVENTPPVEPTKVRYDVTGTKTATLEWTPATDAYDIARYNVYKYNPLTYKFQKIGSSVAKQRNGQFQVPKISTTFDATNLSTKPVIIAIETMDCTGNFSKNIIVNLDLTKTNNGVNLSEVGGISGITTTVDDLVAYAQVIKDGGTSTKLSPETNPNTVSDSLVAVSVLSILSCGLIITLKKKKK